MKTRLVAGSRDSALALAQTAMVIKALETRYPKLEISLKTYKTQGDIRLDTALSKIGDKGLFVKELEVALLDGEIDFAVHSLKDMPSVQPEGLVLLPFGERESPLDAFVSKQGLPFQALPPGAIIGTSSLRRGAVLKHLRPDIIVETVRGNVQTRLRKLEEGPFDAIILASAGLHRLDLSHRITHLFPAEDMIPACCQGTLGVEIRQEELEAVFQPFIQHEVQVATRAERAFLRTLEGGCQVPMAAYAFHTGEEQYRMHGLVADPSGQPLITDAIAFPADAAEEAGQNLAQQLLAQGGDSILAAFKHTR